MHFHVHISCVIVFVLFYKSVIVSSNMNIEVHGYNHAYLLLRSLLVKITPWISAMVTTISRRF